MFRIFTLIFCLCCLLYSCEGLDYKLEIKNETGFDIYVIDYDTSSLNDYPNKVLNFDSQFIAKDSVTKFGQYDTWDSYVKNARNKGLNLFVILADTVDKLDRDYIIKNKIYCKQLFYSYEELKKLNWRVTIE
jgi:hypothetical protein